MKESRPVARTVLVTGCALAMGCAVAGANLLGIAHAETYGSSGDLSGSAFALELYADGMTMTPIEASGLAHAVCLDRAEGTSESDEIDVMAKTYSISLSVEAVMGAEFHFCPWLATAMIALAPSGLSTTSKT